MTAKWTDTTVEILGKSYQIKCPASETAALHTAAHYLEDKMRNLREHGGTTNLDRIAVIAALNVVHQLLTVEQQKEAHIQMINERLHALQNKIENVFIAD